ncbi:hypothetical protein F6P96_06000 [Escherichia coli]|nr:hypothetical protein F6P96_06000 [Escherichia coli]
MMILAVRGTRADGALMYQRRIRRAFGILNGDHLQLLWPVGNLYRILWFRLPELPASASAEQQQ